MYKSNLTCEQLSYNIRYHILKILTDEKIEISETTQNHILDTVKNILEQYKKGEDDEIR